MCDTPSLPLKSDLHALWQNTLQNVSRERVHLYATHTFHHCGHGMVCSPITHSGAGRMHYSTQSKFRPCHVA